MNIIQRDDEVQRLGRDLFEANDEIDRLRRDLADCRARLKRTESEDELRWRKFPVLDSGFLCLVDVMGDDHAICDAARISYGKGTRSVSDDRALIRYLMRCRHSSPFEQAELKFLVRCPMDVWRQWIRHRTASVNEYSTRYSEAIDAMQTTPPDGWRLQSTANKQGSGGLVAEWPEGAVPMPGISPGDYLSFRESELHVAARDVYEERLKFGVAREQARKDLPLSTMTEAYWKIDLHNLLHFLGLRMDSHAQREIRDYATIIGHEIVARLFPLTWSAFVDYRLSAMTLTALDIRVVGCLAESPYPEAIVEVALATIENKREREECRAKLNRLGLA